MMPGRRYTPSVIWWIVKKRKWLLTLPFVVTVSGAAFVAENLKDKYRAQTLILVVPQRIPASYVRPAINESIDQRLESITPQILSVSRLERIVTELDLSPQKRGKKGGLEEIVSDMRDDILVEVIKGDLFRVSYSGDDPYKVMQVTQRLASLFVEENLKDREKLVDGTSQFLESQLDRARRQLEEQERKLQEYRERHSGEMPSQIGSNLQVLQTATLQLQGLEEAIGRDRDRRLEVERTLGELTETEAKSKSSSEAAPPRNNAASPGTDAGNDDAATAVTDPIKLAQDVPLKLAQLQALQQQLHGMELRLKPDHPDVLRTKRLIAQVQQSLDQERGNRTPEDEPVDPASIARRARATQLRAQIVNVDKELARKTAEQERLKAQIAVYQKRVESEPERESELVALTRDYDTLRENYKGLLAKKEDAGIAANLERQQGSEQFKTLDPARLPEKPYGPNRLLIKAIGGGIGLVFGLGVTILLEVKDESFRTALEVLPTISLPVLATVPLVMTAAERRRAKQFALSAAVISIAGVASGAFLAYHYGLLPQMPQLKFW